MYVRLDFVKTIVYYIHYTGLRVNVSNIINIYPRSFVAKYFSSIRIEEPFKSHKFCLFFITSPYRSPSGIMKFSSEDGARQQ